MTWPHHFSSALGARPLVRCFGVSLLVAALALGHTSPALAQAPETPPPAGEGRPELAPFDGRLISAIRFEGLKDLQGQFVRNQIRSQEGKPFRAQTVTEDIQRLYRTGFFQRVNARVDILDDFSVVIIYEFDEAKIIKDVQVVGNRSLSDQQLAEKVNLLKGTPIDEFQLGRTRRAIEDLYRSKGYYLVRVTVDEEEMKDSGIVLFRIREGERTKVTDIRMQGNKTFDDKELRAVIKTKTSGLFETGPLDSATLESDSVSIVRFYRDHGYLDARADNEITPSPDGKEAIVTFIIDEGPRYTLRNVVVKNADGDDSALVLSLPQVEGLMELERGDVYGVAALTRSTRNVLEAFYRLGYVDARFRVPPQELRDVNQPMVDLLLTISQGQRFRTGEVIIQGDTITRQNVIRRQIQVKPDLPLDRTALEDSKKRLEVDHLFAPGSVKTTIQPEQPEHPGYRDVLVEVEEHNTGQLSFGVAVSSDSGLIGTINLNQKNFDVFDTPKTFSDLIAGRAFRGGGQIFDLSIAPGFEVQTYSISLTEPYLFDTDNSLNVSLFDRTRIYNDYDENRLGGRVRLGRRFGDVWNGSVAVRGEQVHLTNIDDSAPQDYFDDAGPNFVLGVGLSLVRTTVPPAERLYPGRGARTEFALEQVLGNFTFDKISASHEIWLTMHEDFLERKSVLQLKTAAAYIPQSNSAPTYERYYLGGRTFRGFEFQGVSPRGFRHDEPTVLSNEPIGGNWSFFAGAEYQQPIFGNVNGRAIISVVGFVDSGTVETDFGFSQYRLSVGAGVRLLLPITPVPLAFDFAYPILKQDLDQTQYFSFSVDLPF